MFETPSAPLDPFPGLRPFAEEDSAVFFGREDATEAIVSGLNRSRFVAVVGGSGMGKSSVVRAGVVPALRLTGQPWHIARMRPGLQPLTGLAGALAGIGVVDALTALQTGSRGLSRAGAQVSGNLLVIVDQFEELFRQDLADNADEPPAFVSALLEAVADDSVAVFVLVTLRSEFLGDCERFRGLPDAVNRGLYLMPRVTRYQLRDAIEGPAGVAGLRVTPRFVQAVLNDAATEAYSLGLVQHALRQTWRRRARSAIGLSIDVDDYDAIGRMDALGRHADEAMARLTYEDRMLGENVFVALAEQVARGFFVRRPRRLADLAAIAGTDVSRIASLVQHFANEREQLLTPWSVGVNGDTLIDLASELLLTRWPALRGWLQDESERRERYLRLVGSARLYANGRAEFLRGRDLAEANHFRSRWSAAWAGGSSADFDQAMLYLTRSVEAEQEWSAREVAGTHALHTQLRAASRRRLVLEFTVLLIVVLSMWLVLRT